MKFVHRRYAAIAIASGLLAAGPAFAAEETRSVPAFTAVDFRDRGEVNVIVGKDQAVVLEGDKDLLDEITTEVHDGVLEIKHNRSWWSWFSSDWFSDDNRKLTVRIALPHLTALAVFGAAKAAATGIEGSHFALSMTGAGKIEADGHVDKLALSLTGAGDADLNRLATNDAAVSIVGAGKVLLQLKDNLAANITGAGSILYTGDPHVVSNVTGAGSIQRQ